MGITAELLAKMHGIGREMQDQFALRSHQKAHAAMTEGASPPKSSDGRARREGAPKLFDYDEVIRADTTLDALAKLKPVFDRRRTVTAGTPRASRTGVRDARHVRRAAKSLGLAPMAKVKAMASVGVDPSIMATARPAVKKALGKAKMTIGDVQLFELNEAFAAQSLPCVKDLGLLDVMDGKVNANGGAIALGHPLGCSGRASPRRSSTDGEEEPDDRRRGRCASASAGIAPSSSEPDRSGPPAFRRALIDH